MSVLGIKDSDRLEVIRFYSDTDPVFFSVLNRTIEDAEQRTKDLNLVFTPARGFRVRAQIPNSATVEIEPGVITPDDTAITQVSLNNAVIPPAGVGNIRIDLISLDILDGSIIRTAGAELAAGSGFAALVRPAMPANEGRVPLAFVYVDETPTFFSDQIVVNNAGAIEDIRPAAGISKRRFEVNPANLGADISGGSAGSSALLARANHQHNLNLDDAVAPETLDAGNVSAPGTDDFYARRNHIHEINTETVPAVLQPDASGGAVGTSTTLVRGDHRHNLNVDALVPPAIDPNAGSAGVATTYSHRDHTHAMPAHLQQALAFFGMSLSQAGSGTVTATTSAAITSVTVPANTFPNGLLVMFIAELFCSHNEPSDGEIATISVELNLDQSASGGQNKQAAAAPVAPVQSVAVGALANLGVPACYFGLDSQRNDVAEAGGATVSSTAVWGRAGLSNLNGGGGLDWDPARDTVINFTNMYVFLSNPPNSVQFARLGSRGFYVFGF